MNNAEHAQLLRELADFCERSPLEGALLVATRARAAAAELEGRKDQGSSVYWSEGVCGDGAAILRDGVMVPIEQVVATLNANQVLLEAARIALARFGGGEVKF